MMLLFKEIILGILLSEWVLKGVFTDESMEERGLFSFFKGPKKPENFFELETWEDSVPSEFKAPFQWKCNPKRPGQLALMNKTTCCGICVCGKRARNAAAAPPAPPVGTDDQWLQEGIIGVDEANGHKAIIDPENNTIVTGDSSTKNDTDLEFSLDEFDFFPDDWKNDNKDDPEWTQFAPGEGSKKKKENWLVTLLYNLCPGLVDMLLKVKGILCKTLLKVLSPLVYVSNSLTGLIQKAAPGPWSLFQNGFMAFLNCFKNVFSLFEKILPNISALVKGGCSLFLPGIVGAKDGALGMSNLLKPFAARMNIMNIWRPILCTPDKLCRSINGLGGKLTGGITGMFGIFSKLYEMTIGKVISVLKKFADSILGLISGGRPTTEGLNNAADSMLEISRQQKSKYRTHEQFRSFDELMGAVKGERSFSIQGVFPVGKIVGFLKTVVGTAKETVLKVLNVLNPFAPMKSIVSKLFVETIVSLNTTSGPRYIKQLFPNIEIPEGALAGTDRNLAFDLISPDPHIMNLAAPEMLKSLPIIKEIYREFDEAALEYTNSSLEYLLTNEHVETLVEFTTEISKGH